LNFNSIIEWSGRAIDGLGVTVIVVGTVVVLVSYLLRLRKPRDRPTAYQQAREGLARVILFGLELLIAGDIIRTVASSPTLLTVTVLAIIVLVRTLLSVTLTLEVEGRWPWQGSGTARSAGDAAGKTAAGRDQADH
jgi:uncharacterized membrane protein